jgi:riboflavin kinase / FMN adenylyltransferase
MMRIVETEADFKNIKKGSVLSIGNFDGVHLGHRQILSSAKKIAAQRNTDLTVLTFNPHPAAILDPDKAPGVLTPLVLKQHLLEQNNVDCLVVLKDSYKLLNLSPQDFVNIFLMSNIRPCVVVEGPDFNFGYSRSGSIDTLTQLGKSCGFEVLIVPDKKVTLNNSDPITASSSIIRRLLHAGSVADAAKLLDRPYRLIGQVISGRGKGTQLGFPTANLKPLDQLIPAQAVYAGYVTISDSLQHACQNDQKLPAVFSIGRAKTFLKDHPLLIEAHVLDANFGPLYGNWMAMDFIEYIRPQQIFKSENELKSQIQKDCSAAKQILSQYQKGV